LPLVNTHEQLGLAPGSIPGERNSSYFGDLI